MTNMRWLMAWHSTAADAAITAQSAHRLVWINRVLVSEIKSWNIFKPSLIKKYVSRLNFLILHPMALSIQSDSQREAFCFPQSYCIYDKQSVFPSSPHTRQHTLHLLINHRSHSEQYPCTQCLCGCPFCVVATSNYQRKIHIHSHYSQHHWDRQALQSQSERPLLSWHTWSSTLRRVKGLHWADTRGPPPCVAVINSTLLNIYIYLLCNNWPTYLFCVFQFATGDLKQCHIFQNRVYCYTI